MTVTTNSPCRSRLSSYRCSSTFVQRWEETAELSPSSNRIGYGYNGTVELIA